MTEFAATVNAANKKILSETGFFVVAAGFEGRCREAFKKGHKARRQGGE